jgi:hypothetical protein
MLKELPPMSISIMISLVCSAISSHFTNMYYFITGAVSGVRGNGRQKEAWSEGKIIGSA